MTLIITPTAGRTGRECPGVCFRLYTSDMYDRMEEHAAPEVVKTPIEEVVLRLIAQIRENAGRVCTKELLTPISQKRLHSALITLKLTLTLTMIEVVSHKTLTRTLSQPLP